jgi:hypothetical protein
LANLVQNWEKIPLEGLAVHIRYKDPIARDKGVPIRETLGWLTRKVGDCFCIEHDRTIENLQYSGGSGNGLILQKSCILDIRVIYETDKRGRTGRPILKRFLNYFFKKKFTTRIKSDFLNQVNKSYSYFETGKKVLRGERVGRKARS